jgi:hypothetical protein
MTETRDKEYIIRVNVMSDINTLLLQHKNWTPPEKWHTDDDPANLKDTLNIMFIDLDKPVTALKLGVVYAKYEIAKKLWLWVHYPLIYTLVSMIYTMCIFCLNTYSIINLDSYELIHPAIKVILIIIFTYDIITRIFVIFSILQYDFIESRFAIPVIFGSILYIMGDNTGIVVYLMAFPIILAELVKRLYYRFLEKLLE